MRTFTARHLVAVGIAAAAIAGVGVVRAAIPSTGGSISGCVNPNTGALRVVDAQAGQGCSSFERPITWNEVGQRGQPGVSGPAGPAGPVGPAGPAGPTGPDNLLVSKRFDNFGGFGPVGDVGGCTAQFPAACRPLDAGTVSLPPGSWEVTAQVLAGNLAAFVFQDNERVVSCGPDASLGKLNAGNDNILMVMPERERARESWTWIVTNPGPGNLDWNLSCLVLSPRFTSSAVDTKVYVGHAQIIARPLGTVTVN